METAKLANGQRVELIWIDGTGWTATAEWSGTEYTTAAGDRDSAVIALQTVILDVIELEDEDLRANVEHTVRVELNSGPLEIDRKHKWLYTCTCGDLDSFYTKADAVEAAELHQEGVA